MSNAEQDAGAPTGGPGFSLWRVSNAWQRAVRAALLPWGLTHAQLMVLATLDFASSSGRSKQHEVAELAGMDPMTTSQVVRVLEGKDLVRRTRHQSDGRAMTLAITAKGKRVLAKAMPAVDAVDQQFFSVAGKNKAALLSALASLTAS